MIKKNLTFHTGISHQKIVCCRMGNRASSSIRSPCFDDDVYSTLSFDDRKGTCQIFFENCQTGSTSSVYDDDIREPTDGNLYERPIDLTEVRASQGSSIARFDEGSVSEKTISDQFPALTDNMSSSVQSSSGDEEDNSNNAYHPHLRRSRLSTGGTSAVDNRRTAPIIQTRRPLEDRARSLATGSTQSEDNPLHLHRSTHNQVSRTTRLPSLFLDGRRNRQSSISEEGRDEPSQDPMDRAADLLRVNSSMDGTSSTGGSINRDARADLGTSRAGSSVGGRDDYSHGGESDSA